MRLLPTRIAVTDNLLLRVLNVADAEAVQHAIEQSRPHLEPFMPFVSNNPADLDFRRQWIDECRDAFEAGTAFNYGIVENGVIIGGCSVNPKSNLLASIGYWVHVDHTRRGVATSVARALTAAAINAGFSTVRIRHDEANIASAAIAGRLGFRFLRREPHSIDAPAQTGTSLVWDFGQSESPTTD